MAMGAPYPAPISPSTTRIGWIGIGVMGSAMASRLLSAGFSVTVFSRDPSKSLSLQTLGASVADSPQTLARLSDVVFTMLAHPSDVRSVVLDRLVPNLKPSSVLVDHTSSDPSLARRIASAARELGSHSVDAPVSGGDLGARDGKLAIFAGGDPEVARWLEPVFRVLGKMSYMGPAGCGQSCKIANQIVVGANLVGMSEAMVFAARAGIDVGAFLEVARGGGAGSSVMELFGERVVGRDFRAGGFAEYMVKDLGMGVDVVEEGDGEVLALPGAALSKQLFGGMVANGDGKLGTQGLVTVIERLNGIGGR